MITLDRVDKRLKLLFDQLYGSIIQSGVPVPMPSSRIPAVFDSDPIQLIKYLIRDLINIHGGQDTFRLGQNRIGNGPLPGSQALQHVKSLFPGQFVQ
jgi:hypothetical protein